MKKVFKTIGMLFLGVIALGIVVSMVGGEEGATDTATTPSKQEEKKVDPISQESFDKITQGDTLTGEGGMTIEEVTAILGEADSETESQSGDMVMKNLTWTNLKFESISVTFINDKVSSKTYLK